MAGALTSETYPNGRTLTTTYDTGNRPATLSGSKSGTNTSYIKQTQYWPNGIPWYFVRGTGSTASQNVWHANAINSRMQVPESYEAVGNSSGALLFVSCPNWGVNPSNYGTYDMCPKASATNDNGNVQSYMEYQGGPGYPSFLTFSQSFSYDGINRLTQANDSGGWSRTFNYHNWGNMWVPSATGPLAGNQAIAAGASSSAGAIIKGLM